MPKKKTSNTSKAKVSRTHLAPKGVSGETFIQSFHNEEKRVDDLKIEDYRKMLNDGQVQMIWNAIVNTIMSKGSEVMDDKDFIEGQSETGVPDKEDNVEAQENEAIEIESSKEKQFIENVLFDSAEKGGMSTSFELTTRRMLRAFVEGYRVFEVLYQKNADGTIGIKELAPRAGKNDFEFHLTTDEKGKFKGFRQVLTFIDKSIDIVVENDGEIPKVVKATYGEEFGSNYGRSGLRGAWYHYDKAHKGMYLNHVGHELGAVKLRNLKHSLTNEAEVEDAVEALSRLGMEGVWAMNQEAGELVFEDASDAGVMGVGKEMISLHYSLMAKSILAQFVDLGSTISESGSRSLGESHSEFFKLGLQAIAKIIIEDTWNEVITALIKVNFGSDIYPKLVTNPIDDDSAELLATAFTELVKKGDITESIKKEILAQGGEKLGLDVTDDQIEQEMEAETEKQESKDQLESDNNMKIAEMKMSRPAMNASEVNLQDETESSPVRRELFPDELNVRFVDIDRKLRETKSNLEVLLRRKLIRVRDEIINEYARALRDGSKAINKINIELQEDESDYSEELVTAGLLLLEFGKITAAKEIEKQVPNTTKKDRNVTINDVNLVVGKQEADLEFRLASVANEALTQDMPENQARMNLEEEYNDFRKVILIPTIDQLISRNYNRGRGISFDKFEKDIFAFRYTAILDARTTDFCRALDGRVFQNTDPDHAMLTPPNHFGCRSQWTAITNDIAAEFDIRVDGKPIGLPTFSSINTFKDVTSVAQLEEPEDVEETILHLMEQL